MLGFETRRGAPVEHAGRILQPVAECLTVRAGPRDAALVWNRPNALIVTDGPRKKSIAVPDRSRQVQWLLLLLGAGTAAAILGRSAAISRRKR